MRVRLGHIQGNGTQRVCGPQSGTCAVLRPILSKRGILGTAELSRCLRQKQAKRSRGKHSDRILWMKQGVVFGAALRFSQAGTAPRRENRPSARGTRSVFCKGTMMPPPQKQETATKGFLPRGCAQKLVPPKDAVTDGVLSGLRSRPGPSSGAGACPAPSGPRATA